MISAKEFHRLREQRKQAARETARLEWLRRANDAIAMIAPQLPGVKQAILFGSITQPGRFGPRSDIDVAVLCESIEDESVFWGALERELQRDVDVRPLKGRIAETALTRGVQVYG